MPNQLEDPEDLGHPDQPDNLSGLANDVELTQMIDEQVKQVGEDGEQVHQVHRLNDELQLLRGAHDSHHVLNDEVDGRKVVCVQDDGGDSASVLRVVIGVDKIELGVGTEKRSSGSDPVLWFWKKVY